MAWTAADMPDQSGRVAVVTGANGGLGLETAAALAAKGARVVLAVRDPGRGSEAEEEIRRRSPDARLEVVRLDLASLASVRGAADEILDRHDRVDVLVNNAGVMAAPRQRTADGFEFQWGVSHLGHWALTAHLLPAILRSPAGRVVSITSTSHHIGRPIDPRDPHLERRYGPWRAYGQAKLASLHFGLGLQRAFDRAGVGARSLVAHPGLSHTGLHTRSLRENDRPSTRFFDVLARRTGMPTAEAALSQLRAATDPKAPGGAFYGPRYVNFGPPVRKPLLRRIGLDRAIEILWVVSERETGVRLDVPAAGDH